jgi:hypothetical protein
LNSKNDSFRTLLYTCLFVSIGVWEVGCGPQEPSQDGPTVVDSFDGNGDDTSNDSSPISDDVDSSQDLYDNTGLEEVIDDIDVSFCDDVPEEYRDVPGATSYFTGIYTSSLGNVSEQDTWFGIEEWILIPNAAWQPIQSEICYVVWDTVAVRTELETCLGCSLAMEVSASINTEGTTCPEDIWNYPEFTSWQADYEIALVGDISMFYYKSGSFLGTGTTNESAFNFLTEPQCAWF